MQTVTSWKKMLKRFTGIPLDQMDDYGLPLINDGRVKVLTAIDGYITEEQFVASTIAAQQDYAMPVRAFKAEDISVLVGGIRYSPKIVENARQWHQLTISNTPTSTIPMFVYVDRRKMSFFPTPSANGNTIRALVTLKEPDLTEDDETAGTIAVTNASATVTGTNTAFSSAHIGWQIKLPDKMWYEVSAVASSTSLTVAKLYEGTTTTGADYVLGQVSLIPEEGQLLPVYYAAMMHFLSLEKADKAAVFERLFTGSAERHDGLIELINKYGNKTEGQLNTGWDSAFPMKNPQNYPYIT